MCWSRMNALTYSDLYAIRSSFPRIFPWYKTTEKHNSGKASPGAHGVYLTNGGFWKSAFQLAKVAKTAETADFREKVAKSTKKPVFRDSCVPKGVCTGVAKTALFATFRPSEDPWGPLGNPGKPGCPYRPLISYKIGGMPTKTPGGYFLDFSILMHLRLL